MTPLDIYRAALAAGFDAVSAVRATAIALAESGGRSDARGDLGLQTSTWGPSVGLMQVRSLKAETGRGTARDVTRLDDPVQNMLAAYEISHGGRDWTPWSTYKNGRWQRFLATAQKAAASSPGAPATGGVTVQQASVFGIPTPGDVADKAIAWGTKALLVALGLGLVGAGVMRATR